MKTFDAITLIIMRILCLPAVACIIALRSVQIFARGLLFYVLYGGENTVYSPEDRASISAIYCFLRDNLKAIEEEQAARAEEANSCACGKDGGSCCRKVEPQDVDVATPGPKGEPGIPGVVGFPQA